MRRARGRRLSAVLAELAPLIRGWVAYFRLSEVKAAFEALDQWLRRRLRAVLWRHWKKPRDAPAAPPGPWAVSRAGLEVVRQWPRPLVECGC
ncbi:MAG: group II intron maturase-specific domain-containing protein [Arhodomonas sp.]|nr:group II intron maturase-specific domain-containing protein [Arhodomonas sp.]